MPHVRPFRFGIITDGAPTREEWITRAREAEDRYSTLLLPGISLQSIVQKTRYGVVCPEIFVLVLKALSFH